MLWTHGGPIVCASASFQVVHHNVANEMYHVIYILLAPYMIYTSPRPEIHPNPIPSHFIAPQRYIGLWCVLGGSSPLHPPTHSF